MNAKRITACIVVLVVAIGFWSVNGQQGPPEENMGRTADVLTGIDLGAEIDGMDGRRLRIQRITTEPGGKTTLHSHKDRPFVMHVLQGTITLHSEDGGSMDLKAGESFSGGKAITHWAENKGTIDAIVISSDIFPGE